ncbi:MAG: amidohydrolase [Flammeovirgaceae bacterium]|nr:amidohydrolase [Flammeovirgaceae bacterium]
MKKYFIICNFLLISLLGCQISERADKIIFNGHIYTVNSLNEKVEAVSIKEGVIWKVGHYKELIADAGSETELIDLQGKSMYPGFIEGHAHIMDIGANLMDLDLMGATSYEEIVERVVLQSKKLPEGSWIIGRGWHQEKWKVSPEGMFKGFPSHNLLSEAVPDYPVYLIHASGHLALANAKAMALANISSSTEDPKGGEVFRGIDGNPTGIFNETAQDLVGLAIPVSSTEWLEKSLKLAIEHILENGITSFHEAGSITSWVSLYQQLALKEELKIRLYVMLSGSDRPLIEEFFKKGIYIDSLNRLTIRAVKLYSDGALGSRGAWLLEEYADAPGKFGHNVRPIAELMEITLLAAEAGFQVCTHAIGDRGNREVLNIYERAFEVFPQRKQDSRFRIEHAQHINSEDLSRFKELGVIPAMQAIHMASDRPWAIDRLGQERIEEGAYVWQKLLDQGTPIVNGSDAPVEPINPLASFYAAVSRKTLAGNPTGGYEPSQKMSRLQALRSYTIDAAYGAFEENIKGTIEVGKQADFTILDQDILTVEEAEILKTKVEMTIVGGNVFYVRQ